MLKYLFVALALTTSVAQAQSMEEQTKALKSVAPSVVKIYPNDGGTGICSGVVVSSNKIDDKIKTLVLTAKHCANIGSNSGYIQEIVIDDNQTLVARNQFGYDVVQRSFDADVALLELRDTSKTWVVAPVAQSDYVEEGDPVVAIGYPSGWKRMITEGRFSGPINRQLMAESFAKVSVEQEVMAAVPIYWGNSGGGLFAFNNDSRQYELIGITSKKHNDADHLALFASRQDIQKLLSNQKSMVDFTVDLMYNLPYAE